MSMKMNTKKNTNTNIREQNMIADNSTKTNMNIFDLIVVLFYNSDDRRSENFPVLQLPVVILGKDRKQDSNKKAK